MVEVEGERVLAASCQRKAAAGMKVKTASERAKKSREMVFELLMADQPEREGEPRSQVEFLELGRRHGRHARPPLSQRRASGGGRHAFGHRREPRRLH